MKKETTNTFSKGMMLDLHPMTTPNDVLTNALNATLITHNGNEFILQNDMGNGRVETAFLPAGYVPVGVKEHGGIIYVASHNPITNRNQIGSFPSPEKNIMSEEVVKRGEKLVELKTLDFWRNENDKTAYIKKVLLNDGVKIRPGDKFLVGVRDLAANSLQYVIGSDVSESSKFPKFIRLHLAVITDDNTISYIDEEKIDYWKPIEITDQDGTGEFTLESYREFIDNNYKVYSNKISGTLAIIAELDSIDNYEINWDYDIELNNKDEYIIKISAVNNWLTKNLNPYSITHDLKLSNNKAVINYPNSKKEIDTQDGDMEEDGTYVRTLPFPDANSSNESLNAIEVTINKSDFIRDPMFYYNSTPSMFYGKLNHLTKYGVVDLSKLNSGIVDLHSYRYFIDTHEGFITISWGVNAYLKKSQKITNVRLEYIDFEDAKTTSSIGWKNNSRVKSLNFKQRVNYLGTFEETFKLDDGDLESDNFYLTRFVISVNDEDEYLVKNRFLYTTKIFNKHYITHSYSDFNDIPLSGYIDVDYDIKTSETPLLTNRIKVGDRTSMVQSNDPINIDKSESWIRNDREIKYDINKKPVIYDEDGNNFFYGSNKLSEIKFEDSVKKEGINYSLDNGSNYIIKGSGDSDVLYKYIDNFKNETVEYQDLEIEQESESPNLLYDTFSVKVEKESSINMKVKCVNRAYFNYRQETMTTDKIVSPLVDITNEGVTIDAFTKILGHSKFNYKLGNSLELHDTLGVRNNRGSSQWTHYSSVKLPSNNRDFTEEYGYACKFANDQIGRDAFGIGQIGDEINKVMKDNSLYNGRSPSIVPLAIAPRDHKDDRTGGIKGTNGYTRVEGLNYDFKRRPNTPLCLCFRVQNSKGLSDFKMVNIFTKSITAQNGSPAWLKYKKSVINLMACLFGQILTLKNSEIETYNIWIPNSIIYHRPDLNTSYSFNYKTKIINKPKYIFGDFNQDFVKSTLSKYINDNQNLNNIPDSNTFEYKQEEFNKFIEYSIDNKDINYLINDITFDKNKASILCKIPYIKDGGLINVYDLIDSAKLKTWYYYDGNTVKEIDRSKESAWLRDDDYVNNKVGNYVTNNLALYLMDSNNELILKTSGIQNIGKVEREDTNENYDTRRGTICYINVPYAFKDSCALTRN